LITSQLNHERVALGAGNGAALALLEATFDWAATTRRPDGGVVLDQDWVRLELAKAHAQLEAVRLLNHRMAALLEAGDPGPADSSTVKVLTSESVVEVYRILAGVLGPVAHLAAGSSGALLAGRLERAARHAQINTFGGGVNEIQRELIVMKALGVHRSSR
jgi:alkylation response protein AidB-like acyl-CoA dehydrogenase